MKKYKVFNRLGMKALLLSIITELRYSETLHRFALKTKTDYKKAVGLANNATNWQVLHRGISLRNGQATIGVQSHNDQKDKDQGLGGHRTDLHRLQHDEHSQIYGQWALVGQFLLHLTIYKACQNRFSSFSKSYRR